MNAKISIGVAAVLFATASSTMAQPGGPPPSQPPAQPPGIVGPAIPGLGPVQKQLAGKAEAVIDQTKAAQDAKKAQDEAAKAAEDAKKAYNAAKAEVPLPGQSRNEKEIARLKLDFEGKQLVEGNKTLAATNAENNRRNAVADLREFGQQNPNVTLPPNHPLIKKIEEMNKENSKIPELKLPDLSKGFAFRQADAQNQAGTADPGRVFDNPGSGSSNKPPVDVRPNRTNDPPLSNTKPATGSSGGVAVAPKPQANAVREQERKALDTEAAALMTETTRIVNWRKDLEGKIENLNGRLETHRRNQPDPFNESAVRVYNETVNRLNKERDELIAEEKRFDKARSELLDRALRFEERVKKFEKLDP